MRAWGFVAAAMGLGLLGAGDAEAIKLTIKLGPSVMELAPGSELMVTRDAVPSLELREKTTRRPAGFTTTIVDAEWARIRIAGRVGETFHVDGVVGRTNVDVHFVADAAPDLHAHDFSWADTEARVEGVRDWTIHWANEDRRTWTVTEWATDPALFGTSAATVTHQERRARAETTTDIGVTVLYVRATNYRTDGTTTFTHARLVRTDETVRIESMLAPPVMPATLDSGRVPMQMSATPATLAPIRKSAVAGRIAALFALAGLVVLIVLRRGAPRDTTV